MTKEARRKSLGKPPQPESARTALYVLMLNLLYPAVLGTIFYEFLRTIFRFEWLNDGSEAIKILFAAAVVSHYCIDFLYIFSFEVYGRFAFFTDLTIVVLLYRAYAALTVNGSANHRTFFACFLIIYLTFLPHEVIIWWRYKKGREPELMKAHVWMMIHETFSAFFFVICLLRLDFAASKYAAVGLFVIVLDYALILRERTRYKKVI